MSMGEVKVPFLSDAMGLFGVRDDSIVVEDGLNLNLVHVTAVPSWATTMREVLLELDKLKVMIVKQPRLRLVTNQKELSKVSKVVTDKQIAVVLGMGNMPDDVISFENAIPILRKSGISIIAPCHGKQNRLGSGCLNTDIGLTLDGAIFIEECHENGIVVDLSRSGHRTARDIINLAISRNRDESHMPLKVMASNTGCFSQYHHFCNLPDDVLKNVAKLGGVVGITTLTYTNDERDNSIFPFKDHVVRAVSLCGVDSVCVGSNGLYINQTVEEAKKQFELMRLEIDPDKTWGARFPENPSAVMGPDMMKELYKFSIPYFPVGVSEKVCGGNLLNFFQRALPAS